MWLGRIVRRLHCLGLYTVDGERRYSTPDLASGKGEGARFYRLRVVTKTLGGVDACGCEQLPARSRYDADRASGPADRRCSLSVAVAMGGSLASDDDDDDDDRSVA